MPGPRVKPTIVTAGDVAYSEKLRAAAQRELAVLRARSARLAELEADMRRAEQLPPAPPPPTPLEEARQWIAEHGGSVTAALKQTHPDHGGSSDDFQRTMKARDVIRRSRQRR
jgi:hypothetical protein